VLGIRPEDVACLPPQPKNPPEGALEAVVEVIQPMGAETYLHLTSHAHSFVARVRATEHFSVNQQVSLAFDMPHAHFFDPASGRTIA
jgi:multiple sugar transport system ATP-binding protein